MAKTTQFKIDATRPFYAVVGVTDLAVEFARTAAIDVQDRLSKVDLEPKALREEAKTLPGKVESYVTDALAELNGTVDELNEAYGELAVRGKKLMTRVRNQQATKDAKAAGKTTVAKAKSTKTQTTKSAKANTGTAKTATKQAAGVTTTAAKKTADTAKRNTKATTTAAKNTAAATTKATSDAASKVGN